MSFKKILVPVDFSKYSEKALEYAVFLAKRFHSDVTLLHIVILFTGDIDDEKYLEVYKNIVELNLQKRSRHLKSNAKKIQRKVATVNSVIMKGFSPQESILEFIDKHDFDLVVMGTHGHTGPGKWLIGSVTEKVIRHSQIPVLAVYKDLNEPIMKKVLVPVDFSEYSLRAVHRGVALSKAYRAELHILHSLEKEFYYEHTRINNSYIPEGSQKVKGDFYNDLIKFTGVPESEAVHAITEGKANNAILQYAEKNEIDLIIMSKHGLSGPYHASIGHNTERIVRRAPCSVLVIGNEKEKV